VYASCASVAAITWSKTPPASAHTTGFENNTALVVLVGGDQLHIVVRARSAASWVGRGGSRVIGPNVGFHDLAPHVQDAERDRSAGRNRAIGTLHRVIAELRLIVVGLFGPRATGEELGAPPIVGSIANCKVVIANCKLTSVRTVGFCQLNLKFAFCNCQFASSRIQRAASR
jgi:hypothetical protein